MPAQRMLSRKNIVKFPQYVAEGTSLNAYGNFPNNPTFKTHGQRAKLTKSNEPEFIDNDFGGTFDRQGIIKTREKNTVTYSGRLMEADLELLEWAANLPDGAGTPDESRTWLDSYEDTSGTEIFRIFKGCKVISSTITITPNDVIMLEIVMSVKEYIESDTHGITLGNGSFADGQPEGTPLRFRDLGDFIYDGDEINFRNMTITTTFAQKMQDSNGSETDLYVEPSDRRITGSIDVFKKDEELNEDARIGAQKLAWLVLQDSASNDSTASRSIPAAGNLIRYSSKLPGSAGNDITIEYKTSNNAQTTIEVREHAIIVVLKSGGSTLTEISAALHASPEALALITPSISGTGSTNQNAAVAATNLQNGVDRKTKVLFERFRFLPSDEQLIDQTEATIETKNLEADVVTILPAI